MASHVRVRAYASSANLGPGFDAVAVAHTSFYDEVEVRLEPGSGSVVVETVYGPYAVGAGNAETAKRAVEELLRLTGYKLGSEDLVLRVYKGVPAGRGLGSSGASAAAAVKAASMLLGLEDEADATLLVEAAAGSPHYDNVAASLLGGFAVVARDLEGRLYVRSFPLEAWFVVYVPKPRMLLGAKTRLMREVLPKTVPLDAAARNWARLAMLVAAVLSGDLRLFGEMMMQDEIVEPARRRYIPCYLEAREAALGAGALGVAISGAGPSLMALTADEKTANKVAAALAECPCCEPDIVKVARPAPPASRV